MFQQRLRARHNARFGPDIEMMRSGMPAAMPVIEDASGGGGGLTAMLGRTLGTALRRDDDGGGGGGFESSAPPSDPAGFRRALSLASLDGGLDFLARGGVMRRPGQMAIVGEEGPEMAYHDGEQTFVMPLEERIKRQLAGALAARGASSAVPLGGVRPSLMPGETSGVPDALAGQLGLLREPLNETDGPVVAPTEEEAPDPRVEKFVRERLGVNPYDEGLRPSVASMPESAPGGAAPLPSVNSTGRAPSLKIEGLPVAGERRGRFRGALEKGITGALYGFAATGSPWGALGGAATGGGNYLVRPEAAHDEEMRANLQRANEIQGARFEQNLKRRLTQSQIAENEAQTAYTRQRPAIEGARIGAVERRLDITDAYNRGRLEQSDRRIDETGRANKAREEDRDLDRDLKEKSLKLLDEFRRTSLYANLKEKQRDREAANARHAAGQAGADRRAAANREAANARAAAGREAAGKRANLNRLAEYAVRKKITLEEAVDEARKVGVVEFYEDDK